MRPDIPPETLIQPEEIAEIVWFLLSHRGNAVIDEVNVRRISNEPWK
jgi:NADP-dependent 3-hydroxy acid dehydrogenase YdfG